MATQSSGQFTSRLPIYFTKHTPHFNLFAHNEKASLYSLLESFHQQDLSMYSYPFAFFQTQPTVVAEVLVNLQRKKKGFGLSSLLKGVWTVIIIHSFKAGGATVPPA